MGLLHGKYCRVQSRFIQIPTGAQILYRPDRITKIVKRTTVTLPCRARAQPVIVS